MTMTISFVIKGYLEIFLSVLSLHIVCKNHVPQIRIPEIEFNVQNKLQRAEIESIINKARRVPTVAKERFKRFYNRNFGLNWINRGDVFIDGV